MITKRTLQKHLKLAVSHARAFTDGHVATYIPELAAVDPHHIGVAVQLCDGTTVVQSDKPDEKFTLQSTSKLVVLIGLLEEVGPEHVYSWVKTEPSGSDFASVARLEQFGPKPANPMLNSGAIALCAHIPGHQEEQLSWLEKWVERLFSKRLRINARVLASERRTGDRNRSLAYLLKSFGAFDANVDEVLETYFSLCSFEATIEQAVALPALLANQGCTPDGRRILSSRTVQQTLAIMATCGLYNESGSHLLRTGMPAKSGVSGLILAVSPGKAGVATISPRVNERGTSVAGQEMLVSLSEQFNWHFAPN